jgi:hypothetical protein
VDPIDRPDKEDPMRYACLVYLEQNEMDALPPSEWNALIDQHLDYDAALEKSGHFLAGAPLEPVSAATLVRVRGGRVSVTDGPFAETKEQLGGFILIEARDLNEALQVAAKIPVARFGTIEVRPVRELVDMKKGA